MIFQTLMLNGIHIPKGTFYSNETVSLTSKVPMLFCTTFHEWNPNRADASLEIMSLDDVVNKINPQYGDKAKKIVDAYAKGFPDKKPIEIWTLIISSRKQVVETANAKLHEQSPVYMAWFGWCPPLFNNRMRAFHCSDICFWFRNTDRMFTHTGGGSIPRKLSEKMSDALLNFMHTANPNGSSLSQWPAYTEENGEVMILNNESVVQNDPDREARRFLEAMI